MTDDMEKDELIYRRVHEAPRELLFECMTTPAHLCEFWGPTGMRTPLDRIVVDLRPGGAFETAMVSDDDGREYTMRAIYRDIRPPERLAWVELETGMVTTITFNDLGDGRTEVITHQTHVPELNRSAAAREGFATSLDRFARYVARLVEVRS